MILVKILTDSDGEKIENPVWCYAVSTDEQRTLCYGQAFGDYQCEVQYSIKEVKTGGITCPRCLSLVREIKSIRLK